MNNSNEPLKRSRILCEVLGGCGSGALLWFLIITSLSFGKATTVLIFNSILILVSVVLAVKLMKKSYKIFGIILLVFLVPAILLLLLIGACTGISGGL